MAHPLPDPRDTDIDRMVDAVARDPARADAVKRLLKQRLMPEPGGAVPGRAARSPQSDPEDLWDNLPV